MARDPIIEAAALVQNWRARGGTDFGLLRGWIATELEARQKVADDLAQRNAALREIVESVAAIRETGRGDASEPYDAQISVLTIQKARDLLGKPKERA